MAAYRVTTVRKFTYVKSYTIVRPVGERSNAVSKLFEKAVDKFILKKHQD